MKLRCLHADTCLPDYWGGHHLANIAICAYPMSEQELKSALHNEVSQGAFAGSLPWQVTESEKFLAACHAAIDEIEVIKPVVFADVEAPGSDDDWTVYAYFVFDFVDED